MRKKVPLEREIDVSQKALKMQKFSDVFENHYLLDTLFLINANQLQCDIKGMWIEKIISHGIWTQ